MFPRRVGEDELRRAVETLSFPYIEELSVKLRPGRLSANRFLLSLVARSLGADRRTTLSGLTRQLGLLEVDARRFDGLVDAAETIHFGCERDGEFTIKLYLEFRIGGEVPGSLPVDAVFFAAKWTAGRPAVFSLYRDLPEVREPAVIRAVAAGLGIGAASLGFLEAVLARAMPMAPGYGFPTMEVVDIGTSRVSIDVNVYGASTTLSGHGEALGRLAAGFGVRESEIAAVLEAGGDAALGHISTGRSRDASDFVTLYFGAAAHGAPGH